MKVKSLSRVRLFATPRIAAHQAPPPMGFSRQEYWSGVPLPSAYAEYIMLNPRLEEAQTRIKIVGRNIINLRCAGGTTLMAESEELKSLLMKVKGEWKNWPENQHSKNEDCVFWSHHFMANRWGNNGNSGRLYFGGLQNHCRW